jgi:uncharacterized protein (TIGR02444 family)
MDFPEHPFWNYSMALYGKPGVAEACLRLQDGCGLDVNLLLYACWLAASGYEPPSQEDWRRLIDGTAAWRTQAVEPLRGVRRFLKEAKGIPQSAVLRERVKALELAAEHAQQLAIAALADPMRGGGPPDALAAMLNYANMQGAALSDADRRDLAVIAGCALAR